MAFARLFLPLCAGSAARRMASSLEQVTPERPALSEDVHAKGDECTEGSGCAFNALQKSAIGRHKAATAQEEATEGLWCSSGDAPKLPGPLPGTAPTDIKVLSYNLFWWSLFKRRKGNNASAGKLILANMEEPFDVMGFQECEDGSQVLGPVGLTKQYQIMQGGHGICMAYDRSRWKLLANGGADVGEDIPTRWYGKRGTQWVRLENNQTGVKLFFINHHGPLSINSGGVCGGKATAHNLLQVAARNAAPGDVIVLVGDFNANAGSLTVQNLWRHLVHVFVGPSFGGVDNIFSNVAMADVVTTKVLGSGGSDHAAISATMRVGTAKEATNVASVVNTPELAAQELTGTAKPGFDWQYFWCGLMEMHTDYVMADWRDHPANDPDRCCRACQAEPGCSSWTWKGGHSCALSNSTPSVKKPASGVVSGLSYDAAAREAMKASNYAIHRV